MINVVPWLHIVSMPPGSQTRNVTKYHYQVYPTVFHPIGNRGHPTWPPVMQLLVLQTWLCFPSPRDLSTFGVGAGRKATTVLYPEEKPRRPSYYCWPSLIPILFYIAFDQCTIFNLFNWPHNPTFTILRFRFSKFEFPKDGIKFLFQCKMNINRSTQTLKIKRVLFILQEWIDCICALHYCNKSAK